MHDYNYGVESQQFTFFRVPKVLVTEQEYEGLTYDAMFMYGVMLDRMSLSSQNGWMDDEGRVYIIFTIEELMTLLNCSDRKVSKLLDELENGYDLIKRKRQGLGKPNVIYVKKFMNYGDVRNQNRKNYDSRIEKITM